MTSSQRKCILHIAKMGAVRKSELHRPTYLTLLGLGLAEEYGPREYVRLTISGVQILVMQFEKKIKELEKK